MLIQTGCTNYKYSETRAGIYEAGVEQLKPSSAKQTANDCALDTSTHTWTFEVNSSARCTHTTENIPQTTRRHRSGLLCATQD